jgi:hypothetical protein
MYIYFSGHKNDPRLVSGTYLNGDDVEKVEDLANEQVAERRQEEHGILKN